MSHGSFIFSQVLLNLFCVVYIINILIVFVIINIIFLKICLVFLLYIRMQLITTHMLSSIFKNSPLPLVLWILKDVQFLFHIFDNFCALSQGFMYFHTVWKILSHHFSPGVTLLSQALHCLSQSPSFSIAIYPFCRAQSEVFKVQFKSFHTPA